MPGGACCICGIVQESALSAASVSSEEVLSALSLSEAAAEAGFDSVLTFRRAFRKVMNINPGDYQKQVNPIK